MPKFTVLCRIDAFADYVTEIDAPDAVTAAKHARASHGYYEWEHKQTAEFDARLYVTLDESGEEIESTQTGDF